MRAALQLYPLEVASKYSPRPSDTFATHSQCPLDKVATPEHRDSIISPFHECNSINRMSGCFSGAMLPACLLPASVASTDVQRSEQLNWLGQYVLWNMMNTTSSSPTHRRRVDDIDGVVCRAAEVAEMHPEIASIIGRWLSSAVRRRSIRSASHVLWYTRSNVYFA